MKSFLATTALVVLMGGSAYAAPAQFNSYQSQASDVEASKFIGQTIYASKTDVIADQKVAADATKDWDNIGEINEVVIGRDGAVKAVVLGVGGFLGMGEKNVAVAMNDISFVRSGDGADDYFLVVNATKDALNAAPAFKTPEDVKAAVDNAKDAAVDTAAATNDQPSSTDTTTTASTQTNNMVQSTMDAARARLARPEVTREGYMAAKPAELTADKLQGARVYGNKDEDVGEINRLVLNEAGQVKLVVLDIGGFLGMGEREIAVTPDELNIVRNANGDDFRVYVEANKDTLKAQPEYKMQ